MGLSASEILKGPPFVTDEDGRLVTTPAAGAEAGAATDGGKAPDGGTLPALIHVIGGYDGANVQVLKTDNAGILQTDSDDSYNTDGYASHTGNGTSQTLDFGAVYDLIWIRCEGANGFAKVTGTPSDGSGVFCEDGVQQPITRRTQTVKVWSPAATAVYGWAYGN